MRIFLLSLLFNILLWKKPYLLLKVSSSATKWRQPVVEYLPQFFLHRTPCRLGKAERCQEKGKNRKMVKNIKDVCSLPFSPLAKIQRKSPPTPYTAVQRWTLEVVHAAAERSGNQKCILGWGGRAEFHTMSPVTSHKQKKITDWCVNRK